MSLSFLADTSVISLENYIAYILATTVILIIPGPTIILVISQAVAHGRRSVVPLVAGVLLGDFTAMSLSLLGLGTLLSASASLFMICKWLGAMYLFYLGVKLWRAKPRQQSRQNPASKISAGCLFRSSFIVTSLNPKSIAFFVAFLPQFIDPAKVVLPQLTVFGVTFLLLATVNAGLYAIFAGHLSEYIEKENVQKWFNLCGGGALISAGILTAGLRRCS
jgi:threonine/homoserine/homoserine lactone efflux protein